MVASARSPCDNSCTLQPHRLLKLPPASLPGLTLLLAILGCSAGEQMSDPRADVSVASPAFPANGGPRLVIDGAHHNYHTVDGRFAPFAALMRNDGLRVSGGSVPFTDAVLSVVDVLVIANASQPAEEPAFAPDEIGAVVRFVERGGSVLLIADHIPYPRAAAELGHALGFALEDVFAEDDGSGIFSLENGGLVRDPVLQGVSKVRTFAGSAFTSRTSDARSLLRMDSRWTLQSMAANGLSPKVPATGRLQGALREMGKGRVAVFGEAGMFTGQVEGTWRRRIGFHARGAEENKRFILNVVRWLARAPGE
jgi:hypothetical protein